MSTPKKIVIAGGVALGAGTAAKARRMDENAEIILLERGPYVSFANCGLPYYLGNVIKNRSKLLLHTPESLRARFNIDVRVYQELVSVDRDGKTVAIRNINTGETYEENYDKLVLAMGAKPIVPPLAGIDLPGIFSIRTVPDVDNIKNWITQVGARKAVVIGAGFIGLETVENLLSLGLSVTLVEKAPQILPPFDSEMTAVALDELDNLGVETILGDGIVRFTGTDRAFEVVLESGRSISGDLFILGLGVRPNSDIARAAGLELAPNGALKVNAQLQTSDADIYSGGDLAQIVHRVNGKETWIALAGPANKQARVIGMNVAGGEAVFNGAQGTAIVGLGQVVLAMTGMSERAVKQAGLDYFVSYNTTGHHAGYYPGAKDLTIKLIAEQKTGRVLGAQVVGREGVDKRVDVIATAISAKMTVSDLAELDLAYAPPFASAKDPIVMAGMAAENILAGDVEAVYEPTAVGDNAVVLDVRRQDELKDGVVPGAIHIPLDELRDRARELDPSMNYVVYCRSGLRSYVGCRMLKGLGFAHVYNLSGGYTVYEMREKAALSAAPKEPLAAAMRR